MTERKVDAATYARVFEGHAEGAALLRRVDARIAERDRDTLAAGCDLALHCNGKMEEMVALAQAVPEIPAATKARLAAARPRPAATDRREILARLDGLMASHV